MNIKTLATYEETTTINNESGEVLETTSTKQFKVESEPNYIKLYLEDISYFNKLPKGSDGVLYEILKYINYEHEVTINMRMKNKIANTLGCSLGHVNNTIQDFAKKEVLIRVDRGVYSLNTYLFGKGSWKDILKHRKSLTLQVFYSEDGGRKIMPKINEEV